MTDAFNIETRSRSRSKTPGLLFSENGDSDKKGAKKIPTISLIEEEDDVVEVVPSSQGSRPKRQRRSAKIVTSDTSNEVSIESSKNTQKEIVSKVTVTKTIVKEVKSATNGSGESSEQATTTTTVKTATATEGAEQIANQSYFNNIFNAIKTSTPILSDKRSQRISSEVINSNINIAEHPAYKEYKEAGEYWNKFPKTDYTYSELSPHRRELKDGVVAMPNMSRRSIEKYQNRVEAMIQSNPLDETFIRRKFLSNTNTSFEKRSADLQYDSADEVDVSELRRQLQSRRKPAENIVNRFFLYIVTYISTTYYSAKHGVRRIFYQRTNPYTYAPIQKRRGILRSGLETIQKFALHGFSKMYLFVSTILCLDTWLLYTRSEKTIENRRRKRFLLLLLILLPLLLLGGTCVYLDPPKNISFPKITFPKLSFPAITLPSLPKLSFPSISLPSFPKISLPSFNFSWPDFSFIWPIISFEWLRFSRPEWLKFPDLSFSWPEVSFEWLKFSRPEWLKFPDLSLSWPEFSLPSINWPTISLPSLPKFSLPSMPSFNFDISPYTGYAGDKLYGFKTATVEIFDKICEATVGLLNEAQIVWSENFNTVANSK